MSLEPGTRLGPYEILAPLGKGGMGEVYKGRDTRLGRNVAIKVVAESLSADPSYRNRLEREARTISRLQHRNICTIHDIGSEGDVQYLVMEYLEGQTLADRIRSGPLTIAEVLRVGGEVAEAIGSAHRSGVVHRDLKPGNVMLGASGTKVLDFGLSTTTRASPFHGESQSLTTLSEPVSSEGALAGTLPYMSPEQVEGKEPDLPSDIWSLGCILYQMVTGRRPFRASNPASLIHSIMKSEPESMTALRPQVPPRLVQVVARCLEKDPENRWHSAHDLALELKALEEDLESGSGTFPTGPELGARPVRRVWLAAAVALVALVGSVLAGYRILRPDPPAPIVAEGTAVAVLPFENHTGNEQLSYIGLGLAAGLISGLSELPGVSVVGRSRAWNAVEQTTTSRELSELLGVNVVIEGQVQASGPELQVEIATLQGSTALVLWSRSFSGSADDLFELQQEITLTLARVLSVPLSPEDRRRMARSGPSSRAFDYYLQGVERLEQPENPRHLSFAADLFRQAIRIEPEVAIFHADLSSTIFWQFRYGQVNEPGEAEREALEAVRLDPELPEGRFALALAMWAQGRLAESIAELRPVLARHPKPDEAYRELGVVYHRAGDMNASEECLEAAVALGPDNWFNWNALGVFQVAQGDVQGARTSLEKAVDLGSELAIWPRLNLGGVKLLLGDYEGAIQDFEAAESTTSDPDLASNMATAYFFLGQPGKAETLYRQAVSLAPGDHRLRRNLGDALLVLRRPEEARAEYRSALELVNAELARRPQDNESLRSRALYTAKVGDCDGAMAHAEQDGPLLPTTWQNQLDLAATFALCGRTEQALAAAKICVEQGLPGQVLREQTELESLFDDPRFLELTGAEDPPSSTG